MNLPSNVVSIRLFGEVGTAMLDTFMDQLEKVTDETSHIHVYINTEGGDFFIGCAIYDLLRACKKKVITQVLGNCESAGVIMLMAGKVRLATPISQLMIHYGDEETSGTKQLRHNKKILQQYKSVFEGKVNVTKQTLNKWFDGSDHLFTVAEAIEKGILTGVVK